MSKPTYKVSILIDICEDLFILSQILHCFILILILAVNIGSLHTTQEGPNKDWNTRLMARKGFLFRVTSARRQELALKFIILLKDGRQEF